MLGAGPEPSALTPGAAAAYVAVVTQAKAAPVVRPQQVYAAGDLSDPHGTHRTCLAAIHRALERVSDEPWYADCEVWLYRGAWQEWEPQEIDMAVPLSPQELLWVT